MSEQIVPPVRNSIGHRRGCANYEQAPEGAPDSSHVDLFCDCHDSPEPEILANGTDVAWPAGWSQQMAAEWRAKNGLAKPSEPGAGP
jgi:hypothetical protein